MNQLVPTEASKKYTGGSKIVNYEDGFHKEEVTHIEGYKKRYARALKRVKDAYRFKELRYICSLEPEQFGHFAPIHHTIGRWGESFYYYKGGNSKVLAVCHLDSVQRARFCHQINAGTHGKTVYSPVLDDRLGAYTILKLLPRLGVSTDLLLCNDEECGCTTAADFANDYDESYNWIVEFDRSGDDVVVYDYASPEWKRALREYGFTTGYGSYSDISELETVGCKAMNIGVGYYDYHSIRAYAVMEEYFSNVAKFLLFYEDKKDTHFPHDMYIPAKNSSWRRDTRWDDSWGNWGTPGDYDYDKTNSAVRVQGGGAEKDDPFVRIEKGGSEGKSGGIKTLWDEAEEDADNYVCIPADIFFYLKDALEDVYGGYDSVLEQEFKEFCCDFGMLPTDWQSAKYFEMWVNGEIDL